MKWWWMRVGCLYKPVVTWCWFCTSVFSFPSRNVKRRHLPSLGSNQTTGSLMTTQGKTVYYLGFYFPGNSFGDFHGTWGLAVEATRDCPFFTEEYPSLWYWLVPWEKDQGKVVPLNKTRTVSSGSPLTPTCCVQWGWTFGNPPWLCRVFHCESWR